MNRETEDKKEGKTSFLEIYGIKISVFLCVVGAVIYASSILVFFYKTSHYGNQNFNSLGGFMSGIVGTVWSLASVLFFYTAISLQRKELQLQRTDLELTRKEMESQRKEFTLQNETLKKQRFEDTFFKLVALHNEIANNIEMNKYSRNLKGKLLFKDIVEDLETGLSRFHYKDEYDSQSSRSFATPIPRTLDEIHKNAVEIYANSFYKDSNYILSNYFRNLYHIYKYIYKTDLVSANEKKFYSVILRAQLSSHELELIFFNGITDNLGYPKFLFLMKEYDVMQNFDFKNVLNEDYEKLYQKLITNLTNPFDA